jgi:hypothetical protein
MPNPEDRPASGVSPRRAYLMGTAAPAQPEQGPEMSPEMAHRRAVWAHLGLDPVTGLDPEGYDHLGYHHLTGLDRWGYARDGFDPLTGRDRHGYDRRGYDEDGFHKITGRDREGYDLWGYDETGHDRAGYHQFTGLHRDTGLDRHGFDINGWSPSRGVMRSYNFPTGVDTFPHHMDIYWQPPEGAAKTIRTVADEYGNKFTAEEYRQHDQEAFTRNLLGSTLVRDHMWRRSSEKTGSEGIWTIVGPKGLSDEISTVKTKPKTKTVLASSSDPFSAQENANLMRSKPQLFEDPSDQPGVASLRTHMLDEWASAGSGPRVGDSTDITAEPRYKVVGDLIPGTDKSRTQAQALGMLASLHGLLYSSTPHALPDMSRNQSPGTQQAAGTANTVGGLGGTQHSMTSGVHQNTIYQRSYDYDLLHFGMAALRGTTRHEDPVEHVHIGGLLYDGWHGPDATDVTRHMIHSYTGLTGDDLLPFAAHSMSGSTQRSGAISGSQFPPSVAKTAQPRQVPGQLRLF